MTLPAHRETPGPADSRIPSTNRVSSLDTSARTSTVGPALDHSQDEHNPSQERRYAGSSQPNDSPPVQDRGKAAWWFLAAASVILQVTWGELTLPPRMMDDIDKMIPIQVSQFLLESFESITSEKHGLPVTNLLL
jgi:hypothetical protein